MNWKKYILNFFKMTKMCSNVDDVFKIEPQLAVCYPNFLSCCFSSLQLILNCKFTSNHNSEILLPTHSHAHKHPHP